MKVLLQRVSSASVEVDGQIVGQIGQGLLLLTGFAKHDTASALKLMAAKAANLRIFPGEDGRFHLSVLDIKGGVLVVPQFTLFADTSKGRRPEFFGAMDPTEAEKLFLQFIDEFRALGLLSVASGIFGAHMKIRLENDGPVTIMLET